ncbi:MAG: hypothetical protein P8I94_05565, partial [Emcibacteraceae bacterium]|nr:hypothetical protein [Emcibacteraceae bacterium]
PSIVLLLASASPEDENLGFLVPSINNSDNAKRAFSSCENKLWLDTVNSTQFATLEPRSKIDINALLNAKVELETKNKNIRFRRSQRMIIPLVQDETTSFYNEVSRIVPGQTHIVISANSKSKAIEEHLTLFARPGFKKITPLYSGYLKNWTIFVDVELPPIEMDVIKDLMVLCPLTEDAVIQLKGGLPLVSGIWHSQAMPVINVLANKGPIDAWIEKPSSQGNGVETHHFQTNGADLELSNYSSAVSSHGELLVAVKAGKEPKVTERILVRSSDKPRPLTAGKQVNIEFCINSNGVFDFVSAKCAEAECVASVKGPIVSGAQKYQNNINNVLLTITQLTVEGEDEKIISDYLEGDEQDIVQTCSRHHIWKVPTVPQGGKAPSEWACMCSVCGESYIQRRAKKKSGKKNKNKKKKQRAKNADTTTQNRIWNNKVTEAKTSVDYDLCFDALCYLGGGRWKRVDDIFSSQSDNVFGSRQFISDLSDLGHLDIQLDLPRSKMKFWQISEPTIVILESNKAYLTGFRNNALIRNVSEAFDNIDARRSLIKNNSTPKSIFWSDFDKDLVVEILGNIQDVHGRNIKVVEDPAEELAWIIGSHHLDYEKFPIVDVDENMPLEKFDLQQARWKKCDYTSEEGAYRTNYFGQRYFFKDSQNFYREGSHELIKVLAARRNSIFLHSYDKEKKEFFSTVGAEPKGLLGRALTLSSGTQSKFENGFRKYVGVSETVAANILNYLYN